jgi:hypothetical protein
MIDKVIGPGFINSRNTCYVNALVQILFHILPLRLMIVAWRSRDLIISALRLMFVAMSQNGSIDAVSLSTVCEPDVFDGKDCVELALQILGAQRDASSRMLRDTTKQLFCFRQITRFSTAFSSRCVPDRPLFFWHLPVSGSSILMEWLNSYFRIVQFDTELPQTQQIFIRSFPRFFFLSLGRYLWGNDHVAKYYRDYVLFLTIDIDPGSDRTIRRARHLVGKWKFWRLWRSKGHQTNTRPATMHELVSRWNIEGIAHGMTEIAPGPHDDRGTHK